MRCKAGHTPDPQYKDSDIYDVVAALLGQQEADQLRRQLFLPHIHGPIHPQTIRSAHLHRGELDPSELLLRTFIVADFDPSFAQAYRALARITEAAIIEWLRHGGIFSMKPFKKVGQTNKGSAP